MDYPTSAKRLITKHSTSWPSHPFRKKESSDLSHLTLRPQEDNTSLLPEIEPGSAYRLSRPTWRVAQAHTLNNNGDLRGRDYRISTKKKRSRCCWPGFKMKYQVMRAICFNLHIGLVLLHCILLGISFPHFEHRKVIPLGFKSTAWSTGVPALSQAFITLYSAAMLVLTQQLSLRRNLLVNQSLTSTHDKSTAWNGLGSSLLSLWRQVSITAAVWGVASITLYLAGISVLHISTPTLVTLEAFNDTIQTDLRTTRGLPNPDVDTSDSITPVYTYFLQAAPILPLIGQYSQLSSIGLNGSMVYDMLPDNQGIGNVMVNSTVFDVNCDVLPNPRASNGNGSSIWNITSDPLPDAVESDFQVSTIAPNVIRMALSRPNGRDIIDDENRVIYYSSINFTDSQGGSGTRVTLNPSMSLGGGISIYSLQVMACRFSSRNATMLVDVHTKLPVELPPQKTSSTWGVAQPSTTFDINSTELSTISDFQGVLSEVSKLPSNIAAVCSACLSGPTTVIDQFLTQQLGVIPDIDPVNVPQPHPELQLYQLENALANLAAALHWSTTQMNPENSPGSTLQNMAFSGRVTVSEPQLASRPNLNVVPISVGLGASVILLIIAIILVGNLEGPAETVDSIGILHLIWLLRDRPDLQKRISRVETPSADDLRSAGMFRVRLVGENPYIDREMAYHNETDADYR